MKYALVILALTACGSDPGRVSVPPMTSTEQVNHTLASNYLFTETWGTPVLQRR
jgi:hypothetical protein